MSFTGFVSPVSASTSSSFSQSTIVGPNVLVSFMSDAVQRDDVAQLRSCLDFLVRAPSNKNDYHDAIHR